MLPLACFAGAFQLAAFSKSPFLIGVLNAFGVAITLAILFTDLQPLTAGFIALIVKNGRADMLPYIAAGFCSLLDTHRGIVSGTITSAVALDEDSRKKLMLKLSNMFEGQLQLTEKVDASLIGGFIVKIGNQQIDSSVASKLKKLRQELTK